MEKMNSLFPSIVSRSQSSGLMNFFVPIISIVLTLITGSIIFVLLGFDPVYACLLYTSPSPRDMRRSRMPSSA